MAKNKIDGVLLLNKPKGLSSNQALQKIKWLYQAQKAGHTGTLDPLATGVLPICFGEATKFSSFLLDSDKEYIATIKLGEITTTYDAEGEVVARCSVKLDSADIINCVRTFLGTITQTPPIYSALKVNGKALYEYARSGQEVAIKTRQVTMFELEILEFINSKVFKLRVRCSKGSYIRSLAHDIGQKLGCGAYLLALSRIKTNNFLLNECMTIEHIANLTSALQSAILLPVDTLVQVLPRLDLHTTQFNYLKNGHKFNITNHALMSKVRLYYADKFLGVASSDNGVVKPVRLMTLLA